MTDQQARQAERQGDTLAVLAHRLRAGTLSRDGLELASYAGHVQARELVNPPVRPVWETRQSIDDFLMGLTGMGDVLLKVTTPVARAIQVRECFERNPHCT